MPRTCNRQSNFHTNDMHRYKQNICMHYVYQTTVISLEIPLSYSLRILILIPTCYVMKMMHSVLSVIILGPKMN